MSLHPDYLVALLRNAAQHISTDAESTEIQTQQRISKSFYYEIMLKAADMLAQMHERLEAAHKIIATKDKLLRELDNGVSHDIWRGQ